MNDYNDKKDRELRAGDAFAKYLGENEVRCMSGKGYDFYYTNLNFAIEAKLITHLENNKEIAQFITVTRKLKQAIQLSPLYESLDSEFIIKVPREVKLSPDKMNSYAEELLQGLHNGLTKIEINKFEFNITKKTQSKTKNVYFFGIGRGGSIDVSGDIYRNTIEKVRVANRQLDSDINDQVQKRIVLFSIEMIFYSSIEDIIDALNNMYEELLTTLTSIDEIWLQITPGDSDPKHILLYSKDFFSKFERGEVEADNKNHHNLFQLWYWAIEKDENKRVKTYSALEKFIARRKPYEVFEDRYKRERMVNLVEWLLDTNEYDKACWLLEKFIDDPDPEEPGIENSNNTSIGIEYHDRIQKGEDALTLTTVMGQLAYQVSKLVEKSSEENIEPIRLGFSYARRVIENKKNLYVIQQWIGVLHSIASRRMWILRHDPELYKEFREYILSKKTGVLSRYCTYKAIANELTQVFYYFKDLNTDEVSLVLEKLSDSDEFYILLIYFAVYRTLHYTTESEFYKDLVKVDPSIFQYDSTKAEEKLSKILKKPNSKEKVLRGAIIMEFWRIIRDDPKNFNLLEQWIVLALESKYDVEITRGLGLLIFDLYSGNEKYNDIIADTKKSLYLQKYLANYCKLAKSYKPKTNELDISIDSIIDKVIEREPEKLGDYANYFFQLWKEGVIVWGVKELFVSYKSINDKEVKSRVKEKLKLILDQMIEIMPSINKDFKL